MQPECEKKNKKLTWYVWEKNEFMNTMKKIKITEIDPGFENLQEHSSMANAS